MAPLRCLCLHGAEQDAEVFRAKTDRLQAALAGKVHFLFLDGPFVMRRRHQSDEVSMRGWFAPSEAACDEPDAGWPTTRLLLEATWAAAGGFELVLGFSQGCVAALRFATEESDETVSMLRGLLLFGCPCLSDTPSALSSSQRQTKIQKRRLPEHVKAMFVCGASDTIVPPEESADTAYALCDHPVLHIHRGGHAVPLSSAELHLVSSFVESLVPPLDFAARILALRDECEMLRAVFGEECVKLNPPKTAVAPTVIRIEADADRNISMVFHVPQHYPDEPPKISFDGLPDALQLDFKWQSKLQSVVADLTGAAVGTAMLLQLFSCAKGALDDRIAQWERCGGNKGVDDDDAAGGTITDPWSIDESESERQAAIRSAHDTALLALAARSKTGAFASQTFSTSTTTTSRVASTATTGAASVSRPADGVGEWKYVIGLVGKPSAGKSTFFNAVTDPTSEAEAAKVGAFPFTTIEPNIGKAFVAQPCACQFIDAFHRSPPTLTCGAVFGHFPGTGMRRVPVTIKDVAGLVPGAYLGRGKGNRFLNDLCDADVLVHVVDASGFANAEGQLELPLEGTDVGGVGAAAVRPPNAQRQPTEDVHWVREEIHSWIFDNVRAKWDVIRRKPLRLLGMFSGYHARPGLVDGALEMCGVTLGHIGSVVPLWTPLDLHLLVACFMALRFPMVLALNKVDLPGAAENVARVRDAFPQEPVVAMSARLECALLAARRRGVLSYISGSDHIVPLCRLAEGTPEELLVTKATAFIESQRAHKTSEMPGTGTTGIAEVLAAAIALRPPAVVFPVHDMNSFASLGVAVGSGKSQCTSAPAESLCPTDQERCEKAALKDCVLMHRGATVEDFFNVLCSKGVIDGNFVRCEAYNLSSVAAPLPASSDGAPSAAVSGIKRRDDVLPQLSVLKLMTNKKHGKTAVP